MTVVVFATGVILLIAAFFLYDRLVSYQYEHFREDWNAAGGPNGFFWTPPENGAIFGIVARGITLLKWTFFSEPWMLSNPRMRKMSVLMRLGVIGFWLSCVAVLIFQVR
jgi:hypothetical protein